MRKLRLLATKECDRNCDGCCNNDWDLDSLPVCDPSEFAGYNEILITGGEPFLFGDELMNLCSAIYSLYMPSLYVYTAMAGNHRLIHHTLLFAEGITVTLHHPNDYMKFNRMWDLLDGWAGLKNKSLRLNVFKGVVTPNVKGWQIRDNIEWQPNCQLPEGEEFKQLKNLWSRK